jgi:Uma2 family endonuclease
MATAIRQRMTVDEFHAVSEEDPRRLELIDGEVVVMPDPKLAHARVQAVLLTELTNWERQGSGRARAYGPTQIDLTRYDSFGPDLVIARPGAPTNARGLLAETPLICVEIRSPSTWRYDVGRKKSVYESEGLAEAWLLDHFADTILVFRHSTPATRDYDIALELGPGDTLTSPLLPGFSLVIDELLASL